jgi:hypothetical protein
MKARCTYRDGMLAAEEPEFYFDGPILRVRGELAGTTHHEAAHGVFKYALGCGQGPVSVTLNYRRSANGAVYVGHSGLSGARRAPGEIPPPRQKPQDIPISLDSDIFMCWRPMMRLTMIAAAGHASERQYFKSQGLPFTARSGDDREACEIEARRCFACSGRNGNALLRLAWHKTQTMLDDPQIWRAVQAVEGALFSGILWKEPADPRPGDEVEFAIKGADVEALIESTGLRFGAYWQEHRCSPECVRARPITKRIRATVEQWAADSASSLKSENIKELCE